MIAFVTFFRNPKPLDIFDKNNYKCESINMFVDTTNSEKPENVFSSLYNKKHLYNFQVGRSCAFIVRIESRSVRILRIPRDWPLKFQTAILFSRVLSAANNFTQVQKFQEKIKFLNLRKLLQIPKLSR